MKTQLNNRQRKRRPYLSDTCILFLTALMLGGCVKSPENPFAIEDSYEDYYSQGVQEDETRWQGMAEDLAVLSEAEDANSSYESSSYAELLINDTRNQVIESYHCFEQLYPASLTKIMTAILTLEHGDLEDEITLKHDTVIAEDGAVVSALSKGDTVSVDQVFHTMMIKSANDCAVILAEYIAGSQKDFVAMMNEKAQEIGATHTHFENANGLHADTHYTTAYDLYLMFKEAVKYDVFVDAISMKDYTMTYVNAEGHEVSEYMQSTNYYLLNTYPTPEGVTMYGGKTGTTSLAKSCLMLMTENAEGEKFFSIVLGAENKDALYASMTRLLEKTTN